MRIYISGPITGVSDYRERFKAAQERIEAAGHKVINPAELCEVMPEAGWADYMDMCKMLLMHADALYQLYDWENSKGAVLEHRIAALFGIKPIKEDEL